MLLVKRRQDAHIPSLGLEPAGWYITAYVMQGNAIPLVNISATACQDPTLLGDGVTTCSQSSPDGW